MNPPNDAVTTAARSKWQFRQCLTRSALRSYLAEFISTFFFVFAAVGSTMSAQNLTAPAEALSGVSSLVATAVAQGCALYAAIYIAYDLSGAHINPAVTFAYAVVGRITIPKALFYWAMQLLSATFACLVLREITVVETVPTTKIRTQMTGFGGAVIESFITFLLVYTIFVSTDQRTRKGPPGMAPGIVMTAMVMAAGGATGGSMNPARSFGPAVVSGHYGNQAVYWVGPLIGAIVAALVHQNLLFPAYWTPLEGASSEGVAPSVDNAGVV